MFKYLNNMDSFNFQIRQIHLKAVNDLLISKPIQQATLNTAQFDLVYLFLLPFYVLFILSLHVYTCFMCLLFAPM